MHYLKYLPSQSVRLIRSFALKSDYVHLSFRGIIRVHFPERRPRVKEPVCQDDIFLNEAELSAKERKNSAHWELRYFRKRSVHVDFRFVRGR